MRSLLLHNFPCRAIKAIVGGFPKASNGYQLTEFCKKFSKKQLDSHWSSVWPVLKLNQLSPSFLFDPSCRTIEFCWKQFECHKLYACRNYLSIHSKKLIIITYNCLLFTNIFSISYSLFLFISFCVGGRVTPWCGNYSWYTCKNLY